MPAKPRSQLTPEQKRINKIESELMVASNRARSQFSFGKLKTYRDLLKEFNYPDSYGPADKLDESVDFAFVKRFCIEQQERFKLTLKLWQESKLPWWQFLPAKHDALANFKEPEVVSASVALVDSHLVDETEDDEVEEATDKEWREFFSSPKQRASLRTKQLRAAVKVYQNFKAGHWADLMVGGTGIGKTFTFGAVIRRLTDDGYFQRCISPWPCIVITRASIVQQTEMVLRDEFELDVGTKVHVLNIEQLRSQFGKVFIHEVVTVVEGQEYVSYQWMPFVAPKLIVWDECQALKNSDTTQSRIAQGYSDIPDDAPAWCGDQSYQLFSSATPFVHANEAKVIVTAMRIKMSFGIGGEVQVTNQNWLDFVRQIAGTTNVLSLSQTDREKANALLMSTIQSNVIDIKGMRSQFKANNKIRIIQFRNQQERDRYIAAWDIYQAAKAKIEQRAYDRGQEPSAFEKLAAFTIFAAEAEDIRAEWTADYIKEKLDAGFAPVVACRYKRTIVSICRFLHDKHKLTRDQISLIWGGVGKSITKKKKEQVDKLDDQEFKSMLDEQGLDLKDFGIDLTKIRSQLELENDPFIKYFQLGPQPIDARNRERIRFQKGLSTVCLFTFKAGGVGLSLHHCDDYMPPDRRVRRKPSGFAHVEDIPKVYSRPRFTILTPVYSAIELVQGLGRVPRLTSLSPTDQEMVFYAGTIEEDVAANVSMKLRCLKRVVRQRESWESMILSAKDVMKTDGSASGSVITVEPDDQETGNIYELGSEVDEAEEENK